LIRREILTAHSPRRPPAPQSRPKVRLSAGRRARQAAPVTPFPRVQPGTGILAGGVIHPRAIPERHHGLRVRKCRPSSPGRPRLAPAHSAALGRQRLKRSAPRDSAPQLAPTHGRAGGRDRQTAPSTTVTDSPPCTRRRRQPRTLSASRSPNASEDPMSAIAWPRRAASFESSVLPDEIAQEEPISASPRQSRS
jgi:hypothetical protein